MRNTMHRKFLVAVAGAMLLALPVVAITPVGAADPAVGVIQNTSTIDTAAAIQEDALSGPFPDALYVTTPVPTFVPVASVPYTVSATINQLPGTTQTDDSVSRDMDRDAEAAQG